MNVCLCPPSSVCLMVLPVCPTALCVCVYYVFTVCSPALRDNRIELVRATWAELTISISDIGLSDEGQYTCSLFTMPVKTTKALLTVLGE